MKDSKYLLNLLIQLYWAGWQDGNTPISILSSHNKDIKRVYKKLAKRFKVKE